MPPHVPLSARDGRARSPVHGQNGRQNGQNQQNQQNHNQPNQHQHNQREPYYYSNEDIELLHQIVSLGQDLLPTLPKREQLPTTALFRAADIVFPQYGISPDGEDKYSRVIFLVGGMRSTDNLYERFRVVLSRMGIEIEYVDGSTPLAEPQSPPVALLHASPPSPVEERRRSDAGRRHGHVSFEEVDDEIGDVDETGMVDNNEVAAPAGAWKRSPSVASVDEAVEHGRVDQYTQSLELLLPHEPPAPRHPGLPHQLPLRPRVPGSPDSPQSHSSQATFAEEAPGASDTLIQEELEVGPPAKVDVQIMARVADTFFLRFAFLGGLGVRLWHGAGMQSAEQAQYAEQIDREMSLSEAVLVWRDALEERYEGKVEEVEETDDEQRGAPIEYDDEEQGEDEIEDDDAVDSDDTDTAQVLAYRERVLKVAARAYDIALMHQALTHWQAMAAEEADRTQVARRHVLRHKAFGGWRAQTARDTAAVVSVAAGRTLRKWRAATTTAMARRQQAEAKDARDLQAIGFWRLLRARQAGEAQRWRKRGDDDLTRAALVHWRQQTDWTMQGQAAATMHHRFLLLGTALDHWADKVQAQTAVRRRIAAEEALTYRRAALRELHTEAWLARTLRQLQANRAQVAAIQAVAVWRQRTTDALQCAAEQDRQQRRACAVFWAQATKLQQFRADVEADLKAEALQSWVLAEKLAFYARYRDARQVSDVLAVWRQQTVAVQTADDVADARADRLRTRHWTAQWVDRAETHLQCEAAAQAQAQWQQATAALDGLAEAAADQAARDAAHADLAARGAYYVAVTDALAGWGTLARQARETRLRATYHGIRRAGKRRTAAACVRTWRRALQGGPTAVLGAAAKAMQAAEGTRTVVAALDRWLTATDDACFRDALAADADVEAQVSRWRLRRAGAAAVAAAAAEHHAVSQLAARWDVWELQAVQARARQHTAVALQDKTDRRLLRRVVGWWEAAAAAAAQQEEAGAEGEADNDDDESDGFGHTTLGHTAPWRATLLRHPVLEASLRSSQLAAAQTPVPRFRGGRGDRLRHTPLAPPLAPPPSSARLRHRLLSAARLADSVQLGPMSVFDEGEDARDMEDADDADDADDANNANDADMALEDLAEDADGSSDADDVRPMRPLHLHRLGTTTPMGPVPSPFERRLRAAYRSSWTPGVTFEEAR